MAFVSKAQSFTAPTLYFSSRSLFHVMVIVLETHSPLENTICFYVSGVYTYLVPALHFYCSCATVADFLELLLFATSQ